MTAASGVLAAIDASGWQDRLVRWADYLLPWITLLIMSFYMVQWLFVFPYSGFRHSIARGQIDHMYLVDNPVLLEGDRLLQVNGVPYDVFQADYRLELFRGLRDGDVVPLVVARGDDVMTVDWVMPGPTRWEIQGRLSNQWWLAFAFWLAGAVVWLSVRPRDQRRTLLMLFNFVTALWFVVSPFANLHLAGSMFVFKVAMWFSMPIYLQLHWLFPSPLRQPTRAFWYPLYGVAAMLGILELLQWVPQNLFYLSFAIGAGGSILLVLWRYLRRPEERAFVAPLALALALGTLVPLLGLVPLLLRIELPSYVAGGTLMTLAALPGAYVYTILQQQVGERAPRLQRLQPLYMFLVVVGVLIIVAVALLNGVVRRAPPAISLGIPFMLVILAILLVSFVPLISLAAMASALQTPLSTERLGFRASRLFAPLMFGIFLLMIIVGFAALLLSILPYAGSGILISVASAGLSVFLLNRLYQPFVRLVDQRLLGIPRIAGETQQRFAARISARLTRAGLTNLLTKELLPALLIRQSALVLVPQRADLGLRQSLFYADGLDETQLPKEEDLSWLRETKEQPARPGLRWIRHLLKMRIGGELVGVWLLGQREPDNFYSEPEVEALQLMADQLAVAVIHITQSALLRDLYSATIEQQELANRHLAGELHDEVLSHLAALRMFADDGAVSPQFDAAFDALTTRIRHTISGLRPALLTYGLASALEELVEDLDGRTAGIPAVRLALSGADYRLPKRIEEHLFRIVQQAAENGLEHAQAAEIVIRALFAPEQLLLEVIDDGVGMPFDVLDQIPRLVRDRHFGLAGMIERAALVGANLSFSPGPNGGTRVRLTWRPADHEEAAD